MYVELIAKRDYESKDIAFTADVDGAPVPVMHFELEGNRIALALPLMSQGTLTISGTYQGKLVYKNSYSWSTIKWLSRANYRMHGEAARSIRDIDRVTYSKQIHVRPTTVVESSGTKEWIVKGVVCAPKGYVFNGVRVLDQAGKQVSDPQLFIGQPAPSEALGMKRMELPFTIRFAKGDDVTVCVVADGDDNYQTGFMCLDPDAVAHYAGVCSPLFYRCSGYGPYKGAVASRHELIKSVEQDDYAFSSEHKFSIIVPLYKTPINFLRDMVNSVRDQIYPNWELVLVNASPEIAELKAELAKMDDERIKIIELADNKGIAENTNAGIEAATGDFIVFFDHDDTLDPFALYRYVKRLEHKPQTDALYCNEDFLNEEGEYVAPHYKSDFNLDLLRVHNYITHLLCVRATLVKGLMLRKEFDGAQDYDFLLRLVEKTQNIEHIDEVLYHWRISDTSTAKSSGNKNYADEAGRKALQEHLDRCGILGTAETTDAACFYHVTYELTANPLVSIVIPNKDSIEVLSRCIESVEQKTDYDNYEVVIVENNSTEQETFDYYKQVQAKYGNVHVVTWDGPFNYSAINNYGVTFTKGEYLLFLNNDVEVIEPSWMRSMLSFCQREDVGAVGAKLLYPDNTVQHAGVLMIKCNTANEVGGPIHVFNNLDLSDPGYMRRAVISQDLTAVTAACMLTKRSIYEELGGFSEDFVVAFNDIDYCLRVREQGKLVVFDADALLYHYESFSRGYETGEKVARFMREQGKLRTAWAQYYVDGDPYHSANSTR